MNERPINEENVEIQEEVSEKPSFKELMFKEVSTLIGGILIGGTAALFLLILLIIALCK